MKEQIIKREKGEYVVTQRAHAHTRESRREIAYLLKTVQQSICSHLLM